MPKRRDDADTPPAGPPESAGSPAGGMHPHGFLPTPEETAGRHGARLRGERMRWRRRAQRPWTRRVAASFRPEFPDAAR